MPCGTRIPVRGEPSGVALVISTCAAALVIPRRCPTRSPSPPSSSTTAGTRFLAAVD